MTNGKIVVIGGSAGAVEGLHRLLLDLPADFPAPICAVIHVSARTPSVLAAVLGRRAKVKVVHAEHHDQLEPGTVYIAPPDRHLLVTAEGLAVTIDAKENRQRPSVDPLFKSAARIFGPDCIGVILSGALDDGSVGLKAVKDAGGVAVVQSPGDALVPDMPRNAIARAPVDYALPLAEIPALLQRLVRQPVTRSPHAEPPPAPLDARTDGVPALLACPDCNGTLWEIREGEELAYRCRVGHAYSLNSLFEANDEGLERALWIAVRALEETAALSRKLEGQARERGHRTSAGYFQQRAESAERDSTQVRRALESQVEAALAADHSK